MIEDFLKFAVAILLAIFFTAFLAFLLALSVRVFNIVINI
jgi:hypothetical protein